MLEHIGLQIFRVFLRKHECLTIKMSQLLDLDILSREYWFQLIKAMRFLAVQIEVIQLKSSVYSWFSLWSTFHVEFTLNAVIFTVVKSKSSGVMNQEKNTNVWKMCKYRFCSIYSWVRTQLVFELAYRNLQKFKDRNWGAVLSGESHLHANCEQII